MNMILNKFEDLNERTEHGEVVYCCLRVPPHVKLAGVLAPVLGTHPPHLQPVVSSHPHLGYNRLMWGKYDGNF